MKNKASKRIKGKRVKVYFENPQEGVNFERLFMALSLLLSKKDILEYLSGHEEDLSPILIKQKVSA